VPVDRDQIEQALINLVRNAAEAALETSGSVRLGWAKAADPACVEIVIDDDGPGLKSTDNLFVPFYTTKAHGSGIGMVLSRQIVEAHDGSLTLANREGAHGCRAVVRLPLAPQNGGGARRQGSDEGQGRANDGAGRGGAE
jgi:signal transduction histidine kinase